MMKLNDHPSFVKEVTIPTIVVTQRVLEKIFEVFELDDSPLEDRDYSLHSVNYETNEEWATICELLELEDVERPTSPCIFITRNE